MRSVKEPRLPQKGNVAYVIGEHGEQPHAHELRVPSPHTNKKLLLAGQVPVPASVPAGSDIAAGLNS